MTDVHEHQELQWATDAAHAGDCSNNILASNTFTVTGLISKVVHIEGYCPYCFGEVLIEQPLRLLPANVQSPVGQSKSSKTIEVTVRCSCKGPHEGRPNGEAGCGRTWVAIGVK